MKIKLNPIRENMTELEIGHWVFLFSYHTLVAYRDAPTDQCYVTNQYYSRTTTKHIYEWVAGSPATKIEQKQIDSRLEWCIK